MYSQFNFFTHAKLPKWSKNVIEDGEHTISARQMMISRTLQECRLALKNGTRILLFGVEPFHEERFLLWNFVSHSEKFLEQVAEEWKMHRFPKIKGDDTYIPFPQIKFKSK